MTRLGFVAAKITFFVASTLVVVILLTDKTTCLIGKTTNLIR